MGFERPEEGVDALEVVGVISWERVLIRDDGNVRR
jgi:hypothetical protein